MDVLLNIANFLVNEILSVPAFLIGIIAAVGLAAILQVSPLFIMGWKESARGHELSTAARIGSKILAASPAAQLAIDRIIKEDERSKSHDSEEE